MNQVDSTTKQATNLYRKDLERLASRVRPYKTPEELIRKLNTLATLFELPLRRVILAESLLHIRDIFTQWRILERFRELHIHVSNAVVYLVDQKNIEWLEEDDFRILEKRVQDAVTECIFVAEGLPIWERFASSIEND